MGNSNLELISNACLEVFVENGLSQIDINTTGVSFDKSNITATIGITGDVHGHLILFSKLDTAVSLVEEIFRNMGMHDEKIEPGDQMFKETFAELLNQLGGRSTIKLSEAGIDSDITPPTIIKGDNIYIDTKSYGSTAIIKIAGNFGSMGLFVGLKN